MAGAATRSIHTPLVLAALAGIVLASDPAGCAPDSIPPGPGPGVYGEAHPWGDPAKGQFAEFGMPLTGLAG